MRHAVTSSLLLALVVGVGHAETKDWPGFLGPHRNGKSDERGLPKAWPASGPPVVWQFPMGNGYAAPAIADGRVFLFARSRFCFMAPSYHGSSRYARWYGWPASSCWAR